MKKINLIIATVASAVSGAIIGMLFAPDKGSATREKIRKESDEYLKAIKKELEQKRKELNEQTEKAKKSADKFRDDAKRKGEDLLDRAKKLTSYDEWTKDELYERAKELGIESYSTMNKSELINALRNR